MALRPFVGVALLAFAAAGTTARGANSISPAPLGKPAVPGSSANALNGAGSLLDTLPAVPVIAQDVPPASAPKPGEPKPADAKPAAPPAAPAPLETDLEFLDGSRVKVVLLTPELTVATRYGKLTVPAADLKRVDLGFRYPDGVEAKVVAAIEKLNAPKFQDREEAGKELLALKDHAGPLVKKALKSFDPERRQRAEELYKQLALSVPEERLNAKDYDTVETSQFTIRGTIDAATLRVRSKQFGETPVRLAEVKEFRSLGVQAAAGEVTLDAAKHARLNYASWMDTGVDVPVGAALTLSATGQIDQWPQEAGKYLSGPGGNGQQVQPPQNAAMAAMPAGPNGMGNRVVMSGAVLGRLGDAGPVFVVGANYNLAAARAGGRLQLVIVPSTWGNENCSGEYKVKIKVTEK